MKRAKVACSLNYHNPSYASLTMVKFGGLMRIVYVLLRGSRDPYLCNK